MLLFSLFACDGGFVTDGGQLRVIPDNVVADPISGLQADSAVLAGTSLCGTLECAADCPEPADAALPCFDQHLEGVLAWDDAGCLHFDRPGEGRWAFTPKTCDADYTPAADEVHFTVVDVSEVEAELLQWPEDIAESGLLGDFPSNWRNPTGEPFRVVAGTSVRFPVGLRHPDVDGVVAYNAEGTLDTTGPVRVVAPGWVEASPKVGQSGSVRLHVEGRSFLVANFVGVDPASVSSLDLHVGYLEDVAASVREPLGARAVARDAGGNVVYGAPVEWTVRGGPLAVEPGGEHLPGLDYALLADDCMQQGGLRERTLEVRLDGLSDSVDLRWTGTDKTDPNWSARDTCDSGGGCGCSAGPIGAGPIGILPFLVAIALRRRPRRSAEPPEDPERVRTRQGYHPSVRPTRVDQPLVVLGESARQQERRSG